MGTSGTAVAGAQRASAQRAIRAANLGQVLGTVRRRAPCSRAEVASALGLTRATVSSLVGELMSYGLLREGGTAPARKVGRPGQMLGLDDRYMATLGLEINVDYLTVVALDLLGTELLSQHATFDVRSAGAEQTLDRAAALLSAVLEGPSLSGRRVLGAGVAVPALVDTVGTVREAPNLGWRNIDLGGDLARHPRVSERLGGVPVLVHNDANLAAVAEFRDGHLAGTADLVYLTGEVGIGAGILSAGELLPGAHGFPGELGHIVLQPAGPRCGCGRRGCLEALAGIETILSGTVPERFRNPRARAGADLAAGVEETVDRAERGNTAVGAVLHEAGKWLGRGAAHVCNLLDPGAIVLGGYFVPLAPWLLPAADAELRAGVMAAPHHEVRLALSTLGLSAAARGGAAAPLQALERGQLPLEALGAG